MYTAIKSLVKRESWNRKRLIPLSAALLAFGAGLSAYPGSSIVYLFFSSSVFCLVAAAFSGDRAFGFIFLSVFLMLGFWVKAAVHLFFPYPYLEPTGLFDFSPAGWDQVLAVSAVGVFGVLAARGAFSLLKAGCLSFPTKSGLPLHREGLSSSLVSWAAVLFFVVALAILNSVFCIHQLGVYPRTILPWPGNALVAWLINIGTSLLLGVMTWRDMRAGRSLLPAFLVISITATAFSISMLSRGPFIYQALPLLAAAASLRWQTLGKSKLKLGAAAACLALLFAFSIFLVNSYRTRIYSGAAPAAQAAPAPSVKKGGIIYALTQNRHLRQVSGLFVDRWIGLEGVMAVAAYPDKKDGLLQLALTKNRTLDKTAEFEKISGSDFQSLDAEKHQFARLPGPVALFYYSGSMLSVFCGMFALGVIVLLMESITWFLTNNPLICALVGMMAANNAAQLSEAPVQLLPTYLLTFVALLTIHFSGRIETLSTAAFKKAVN